MLPDVADNAGIEPVHFGIISALFLLWFSRGFWVFYINNSSIFFYYYIKRDPYTLPRHATRITCATPPPSALGIISSRLIFLSFRLALSVL